jgi:hypothetical protein
MVSLTCGFKRILVNPLPRAFFRFLLSVLRLHMARPFQNPNLAHCPVRGKGGGELSYCSTDLSPTVRELSFLGNINDRRLGWTMDDAAFKAFFHMVGLESSSADKSESDV